MTQTIMTDRPAWGSVEGYLEVLREKAAAGWDLYAYAFGIAAATARDTAHSAEERVRRIGNLDTALRAINDEQRRIPNDQLGTGAVVDGGELVPELSVPVHYLEPGADGEDDDQMACGVRFADAVKVSAFSGNPEQVTCVDCRKSAIELDYVPSFGEARYPGCTEDAS